MSGAHNLVLVSHDQGLLAHWKKALGAGTAECLSDFATLQSTRFVPETIIWLDDSLPNLPAWTQAAWGRLMKQVHIVCASSNPQNAVAITALDAGCSAYCHAFGDPRTLRQVQQVVAAGQVWVGRDLMQQLLAGANRASANRAEPDLEWASGLTPREKEMAILAANGASNKVIAVNCGITERTVKAHLAAIFEKLNLTDRLQLALRVHGIN
jgi:DNA-binding NarL/FixJ family response regulator